MTSKQAKPFFVDKLQRLAEHLQKSLGNAKSNIKLFIVARDQAISKQRSLRLVFTSDGVVVGVVIRRVERYDLVKIKPTESEAEH